MSIREKRRDSFMLRLKVLAVSLPFMSASTGYQTSVLARHLKGHTSTAQQRVIIRDADLDSTLFSSAPAGWTAKLPLPRHPFQLANHRARSSCQYT